jgi:SH3-like domain-containing protein
MIIVCMFFLGLVFVVLSNDQGTFPAANPARSGRIVVLRKTQSYRVPDYKGAVNDWFSEGQPVTVGDFRGDWCFAETLDGRSGWVERESVINY